LAVFFVGLSLGQALYGPLADRLGRRPPLFFGCVLYALASIGCAFAPSIQSLVVLRFAQALGGCAGVVISRSIVRDLFDQRESACMYSSLTLVLGLAPITAPLIGGQILITWGWRAIFLTLSGFGLVCLLLVLLRLPETLPSERRTTSGLGMDLMQPRLIQHIIDEGITAGNMQVVIQTGLWMVVLAVIGLGGGVGCTVYAILAGQGFGADLRGTLFGKVQALSFGNLDRLETGKLITRLTNDVTQVQEVVMMLLRVMVRVPLLMIGSLVLAVITSPELAWLFAVLIPIVVVALFWIINRSYPLFGGVQQRLDALNIVMQENLAGVRVVKAFVRAQHALQRFHQRNDSLMEQNITAVRTTAITMPFMMLVLNFGVVAALWIGGVQVTTGAMQVGQVVAFINYLMQSLMALMMVSMLTMRLARSEASAVRIQEVLESEPEVQNKPDALTVFAPRGRVVFEDVSFGYDKTEPVLKAVSLHAQPRQIIALVGPTGAGKTTIVNLLTRFYDIDRGRICIDGHDIRDLKKDDLRQRLGIVLQDTYLFSGTVMDNIRYGRLDATDDEVIAAAKLANADGFIHRLPQGYATPLSERGSNLSQGQRQLLAIARALLADPAILILDEATSSVDTRTEQHIQEAMLRLMTGRTSFVIAHRLSTIRNADQILVINHGEIVERGTHEALLAQQGFYHHLYTSQFRANARRVVFAEEQTAGEQATQFAVA